MNNSFLKTQILSIVFLFFTVAGPSVAGEVGKLQDKLRSVGEEAIGEQLRGMRSDINSGALSIGEHGKYQVSTNIIQISEISSEVKARIKGRKEAIKKIIWETAKAIEDDRKSTLTVTHNNMNLSVDQKEKADKLNQAIRDNNVSLNSLALAIESTVNISKDLYDAANSETDNQRKHDLYINYTVFVYELASIVSDLISDFDKGGTEELTSLYNERSSEVEKIKGRIKNRIDIYKNRLNAKKITQDVFDSRVKQYEEWVLALDYSLSSWDYVFDILGKQEVWTKKLKDNITKFNDLRDEAGLQLEILAEIGIARDVINSVESIEKIIDIADVPLLRLDAKIAEQMLGISRNIDTNKSTELLIR